jgi:hypothetical protein
MTHGECLAIVTGLVSAYPRELSEATLEVYCEDLRDLDPQALMAAVVHLRRTSKWLPAISEIRAEAGRTSLPHAPSVAEAWTEAMRLMARIGTYRALGTAGNPYVNRTLRLCGRWADICQEDTTWLRKRFAEIYADVVGGAEREVAARGTRPEWLEAPKPELARVGNVRSLEDRRG